jgi:predicted ATP-dependent endonuclease of OLD family
VFSRIEVHNFQSLHDLDLELGKLTVVVGASNSGKSALVRSIRTLARNASNSTFVTHGKKAAVIEMDEKVGALTVRLILQRGKGLTEYRVVTDSDEQVYTKSGTSVPDAVLAYLGTAEVEGELLQVAEQFDRPFLLSETATKAAKVLGDLTNVTVIHSAVREANRRRLGLVQKLNVRNTDAAKAQVEFDEFNDLPKLKPLLDMTRANVDKLLKAESLIARLRELTAQATIAQTAKEKIVVPPQVSAELGELEKQAADIAKMRSLVSMCVEQTRKAGASGEAVKAYAEAMSDTDAEFHAALEKAGVCPLCGQEVPVA